MDRASPDRGLLFLAWAQSDLFMGVDKWCRYEFAAAQVKTDGIVLDVGGGSGDFFFHTGVKGIVADKYFDERSIKCNRTQCQFVRFDGEHLPFADHSTSVVISLDTLEHVPSENRKRFLSELRRVSQGKIVMTFPSDVQYLIRPLLAISVIHRIIGVGEAGERNLREHITNGLPRSQEVVSDFSENGWTVAASREFGLIHSLFKLSQWMMPFLALKTINRLVARIIRSRGSSKSSYLFFVATKN